MKGSRAFATVATLVLLLLPIGSAHSVASTEDGGASVGPSHPSSRLHDPVVEPDQLTWTWDEAQPNPEGTANPTLQYVAEDNSSQLAQAFLNFALPAGLDASTLVSVTLSYPEDTSSQDGYAVVANPDPGTAPDISDVSVAACPATEAWRASSVPPGSPASSGPTFDCSSLISPGNLQTQPAGSTFIFDLTPIVQAWLSGTADYGIAIEAETGTGSWSVPLAGTKAQVSVVMTTDSAGFGTASASSEPPPYYPAGSLAAPPNPAQGVPPVASMPISLPNVATGAVSLPRSSGDQPAIAPVQPTNRSELGQRVATSNLASTSSAGIPADLWLALLAVIGLLARMGRTVVPGLRTLRAGQMGETFPTRR